MDDQTPSQPRLVPRFFEQGARPAPDLPDVESAEQKTIRPFLVTGGRTAADPSLRLETQLLASANETGHLQYEAKALLELAATPVSVAEAAAHLSLPIGAIRVLAADLTESGDLLARQPSATTDPSTIRRLIDAVTAL
ncbi:MAG: DUF742 domain-containing protein [Actinomycetota bacterium]